MISPSTAKLAAKALRRYDLAGGKPPVGLQAVVRRQDRKDKIEQVLNEARKSADTFEASLAWQRLCRELENMTHPEARMPRFNNLLHAMWIAASNDQT